MKKIILFIVIFMPFLVLAEDTCNQDDIKIESIVLDSTNGNIEETSNPNTDNNQVNLGLKMNVIDDSITYKLVITNTSNQDYTFDKNSLSTDYLNYDITYEDNTNVVKAGESKVIFLTVNYSNKPSVDKLDNGLLTDNPKVTFNLQKEEAQTVIEEVVRKIVNPETKDVIGILLLILIISLIISIVLFRRGKKVKYITLLILTILLTSNIVKALCTCTLDINTSIEIDAKEAMFLPGKEVNVKMKQLAGTDTTQESSPYITDDNNINAIKYSSIEPNNSNKQEENIVSTTDSDYPIYMWFENGTIYWWSEDETPSLNEDPSFMFISVRNLSNIEGLENVDVSNTTTLNKIFFKCNLNNLDSLKKWKTSNVINMVASFFGNILLNDINGLKNWDVSKVENFNMFLASNKSLESLSGLEDWDVSNVKDFGYFVSNAHSLKDISAIKNWNISNAINMAYFLGSAIVLTDVSAVENWNVAKVENMSGFFNSCWSLEEIDLSNWNTNSLTNMYNMFAMSYLSTGETGGSLKRIILSDKFNTSKVTNMSWTFYNNLYIEDYEFLKYLDTSNVIDMNGIFIGNDKLTTLEYLKDWDVSNVKNFSYAFRALDNLTDASAINNWNISSSSNYKEMFTDTQTHPEFTKVQGTWKSGTFIPSS